jgi:hypothetical protein
VEVFGDDHCLCQTWAPLTETRARSELSAQCPKVSGFPLALAFLKTERARARIPLALFTQKKILSKTCIFSPYSFYKRSQ